MMRTAVATAVEEAVEERVLERTAAPTAFLDRFLIQEFLGKGAEGEIFRVQDKETAESYIAKCIDCYDNSPEQRTLEGQIKALQRLQHANIPAFVAHLTEKNPEWKKERHYLLTKDKRGKPLMQCLEEHGPLSPQELDSLFDQLRDTICYAHAQGVLHRDINPQNIIMSDEGIAYLIDWGVAKVAGRPTRLSTLGVVGTPGYMAPEQIQGEKVTAAADLYSIGAVLIAAAQGEDLHPFISPKELQKKAAGLKHLDKGFRRALEALVDEDAEKRLGAFDFDREEYGLEKPKEKKWSKWSLIKAVPMLGLEAIGTIVSAALVVGFYGSIPSLLIYNAYEQPFIEEYFPQVIELADLDHNDHLDRHEIVDLLEELGHQELLNEMGIYNSPNVRLTLVPRRWDLFRSTSWEMEEHVREIGLVVGDMERYLEQRRREY